MAGLTSYANQRPYEATLDNATATITLPWRSGEIILTNDSGTNDLQFKFGESADYATLQPTEQLVLGFRAKTIILHTTASVAYRLWVYG